MVDYKYNLHVVLKELDNKLAQLCNTEPTANPDKNTSTAWTSNDKQQKQDKVLTLSSQRFGDVGAKKIAAFIRDSIDNKNINIESLILVNNGITVNGAIELANNVFNHPNSTLQRFVLCTNFIGDAGVVAIANAIKDNENHTVLNELTLRYNQIGFDGANAIGTMLKTNKTISRLELSYNSLTIECLRVMTTVLETNINKTLTSLSILDIGRIGGVQQMCRMLQRNTTLLHVEFDIRQLNVCNLISKNIILENSKLQSLSLVCPYSCTRFFQVWKRKKF